MRNIPDELAWKQRQCSVPSFTHGHRGIMTWEVVADWDSNGAA